MRNEYIGTSIDGDGRAAYQNRSTGCNCGARQPRYSACEGQRTQPCSRCGQVNCTCQNRSTNNCDDDCRQAKTCNRCGNDNCTCQNRSDNCGCNTCGNERSNKGYCDRCGKENCTCQNRSDNYGCNTCGNERSGNGYCDHCGKENCTCQNRSDNCGCNGRTPAMVYAAHHDLDSLYCAEKALFRGTLFGCLDKPMCHERCMENPCFTQCQADKFAIWELRLYLNTHPCDQQALALMRKLVAQMDEDCGCVYTPDCGNRWSWTEGPWPWEYQHCCGKEA